jgi:hypothetical protein
MGLDSVRRIRLQPAVTVKDSSEDYAVRRSSKLDGAVGEADVHAVTHDTNIFHVREFRRIHRGRKERIPDVRRGLWSRFSWRLGDGQMGTQEEKETQENTPNTHSRNPRVAAKKVQSRDDNATVYVEIFAVRPGVAAQ